MKIRNKVLHFENTSEMFASFSSSALTAACAFRYDEPTPIRKGGRTTHA